MKKLMTRANTSVKVLVPELKRESDFGRVKSYRLSQVRSPQLCDCARYLHLSSDRFLTLTLRSDATAEPLDAPDQAARSQISTGTPMRASALFHTVFQVWSSVTSPRRVKMFPSGSRRCASISPQGCFSGGTRNSTPRSARVWYVIKISETCSETPTKRPINAWPS